MMAHNAVYVIMMVQNAVCVGDDGTQYRVCGDDGTHCKSKVY